MIRLRKEQAEKRAGAEAWERFQRRLREEFPTGRVTAYYWDCGILFAAVKCRGTTTDVTIRGEYHGQS